MERVKTNECSRNISAFRSLSLDQWQVGRRKLGSQGAVTNPATGEVIAEVAFAHAEDVDPPSLLPNPQQSNGAPRLFPVAPKSCFTSAT